jgi:tetratricopeptide (TPR) repeat protein
VKKDNSLFKAVFNDAYVTTLTFLGTGGAANYLVNDGYLEIYKVLLGGAIGATVMKLFQVAIYHRNKKENETLEGIINHESEALPYLQKASKLLDKQKYDNALKVYSIALEKSTMPGEKVEAYFGIASVLQGKGSEGVLPAAEEALKLCERHYIKHEHLFNMLKELYIDKDEYANLRKVENIQRAVEETRVIPLED